MEDIESIIYNILDKYAQRLISIYTSKLDNKRATGTLQDTISYSINTPSGSYQIELHLAPYWIYVENGRSPGKYPPIDAIKEWIRVKPIIAEPISLPNGKTVLPTENQLAFLIARSIKETGIEPTNYLEESWNQILDDMNKEINDAILNSATVIPELVTF